MNRDLYIGMFFGGIIALVIAGISDQFGLLGLSVLFWVIILDIIMGINLLWDKINEK